MRALRLVNVIEEPAEHYAGSDWASGIPHRPRYDVKRAMSALPANAWLSAAVGACASDLAGLPLRASMGDAQLPAHDVLALFPRRLRAQFVADYKLTGNAFILCVYGALGIPRKIARLHPARVQIIPGAAGEAAAYEYQGAGGEVVTYLPSDVFHIADISWEDDPSGLWGQGAIQSLDADIVADRNLADASARSAAKGRPDAIYRPMNEKVTWSRTQVAAMKKTLSGVMQSNEGGVAVMDGNGALDILGWSPREMEGVSQREWTRDTILARLGVPGTRVGLPNANYATAQAALTVYWNNRQAEAAALDEAFTWVAAKVDDRLTVYHDFSQVEVLQDGQGDALARVEAHIRNGIAPAVAYAYEGFDGIAADAFVAPPEPVADESPTGDATGAPALSVVPAMDLDAAVAELAAALAIMTDPASDGEDVADALVSVDQALQALQSEQDRRESA